MQDNFDLGQAKQTVDLKKVHKIELRYTSYIREEPKIVNIPGQKRGRARCVTHAYSSLSDEELSGA
jgi:hypothetical protein